MCNLLLGELYRQFALHWWDDILGEGEYISILILQFNRQLLAREFAKTKAAIARCPDEHISQSAMDRCLTSGVGVELNNGVELAVVENLILHQRSLNSLPLCIHNLNRSLAYGGVVVNHIYLGEAVGALYHILLAVIIASYASVHQQGACCWLIEPRHIEFGLGLTSSQKLPIAINPHLYPSVVAVGVCPARGIYLTSRDAHRSHSRYGEG